MDTATVTLNLVDPVGVPANNTATVDTSSGDHTPASACAAAAAIFF